MKYAFIVSACRKYAPEICALLNSLDVLGNKHDVFLISYRLSPALIEQLSKLCYKVIVYEIPEPEARQFGGESEIVCRKRYWYAAEWGKDYDSICVLDADMFFIRSVDQYFEIAAKCGMIIGAGLEQKRMYGEIEHHKVRGKHLLEAPVWNAKDICCCPMFWDAHVWGDLFKKSFDIFADGFPEDNFKAPDMESYNLLILAAKASDRVLMVSNYSFVGTNEKLLKPYTRVTTQGDGLLWTEGGEPIYIVHGQFYKARWRRQQVLNRHGCAEGYLGVSPKSDNMAQGAMDCLHEWFKKFLDHKMHVDKIAYTPNGHPDHPNECDVG